MARGMSPEHGLGETGAKSGGQSGHGQGRKQYKN